MKGVKLESLYSRERELFEVSIASLLNETFSKLLCSSFFSFRNTYTFHEFHFF